MSNRGKAAGAAVVAVVVIATLIGRESWATARRAESRVDRDALGRDLELASGVGIALAPAGGHALMVAAELLPAGESARSRAPRAATAPHRRATPAPDLDPDPHSVDAPSVAEDPQGTEVADAMTTGHGAASDEAVTMIPASLPRPTPNPASYPTEGTGRGYPADEPRGGGVGVIIRGGRAGEDRCEIHDRRGRRGRGGMVDVATVMGGIGGVLINDRAPQIGRGAVMRPRW